MIDWWLLNVKLGNIGKYPTPTLQQPQLCTVNSTTTLNYASQPTSQPARQPANQTARQAASQTASQAASQPARPRS